MGEQKQQFMSVKQAAELIGVSAPTAKKWAIECGAFHRLCDKVVRIEIETLYDYIRSK
jgi:hypothetical protein